MKYYSKELAKCMRLSKDSRTKTLEVFDTGGKYTICFQEDAYELATTLKIHLFLGGELTILPPVTQKEHRMPKEERLVPKLLPLTIGNILTGFMQDIRYSLSYTTPSHLKV